MLALDFETTGTDTATDRIVTATVISIVPGQPPRIRNWLADPGVPIPAEAAEVHGISTEYAVEHGQDVATVVSEVASALSEWSETTPLCVFKATFDLPLLRAELHRHHDRDLATIGPVVDPLCLDRAVDRFRKGKRTLTAMCEHYGVRQEDAHTSAGDALATARLAWKLAKQYPAEIGQLPPSTLHKQQLEWHRQQQHSFAGYLEKLARREDRAEADATELRQRAAAVRAEADGWPADLSTLDAVPAGPTATHSEPGDSTDSADATHVWLDVPFAEKDEAKSLGARWDPHETRWFAPHPGMTQLSRWEALPEVPDLLPGEDRNFGSGLFIDLVPSSCWFTNVRSCVGQQDWERLRRMITRRAEQACEACGRGIDRDLGRWLEAHERWSYDDDARTQTLRRLICLCTDCHTATHFGYAQVRGVDEQAFTHLRAITGMSERDAGEHVDAAFELWQQRSRVTWTLDLSMLTDVGVTIKPPPDADERPGIAEEHLRTQQG